MNQRGSVGLYFMFAIVFAIATGYGVYAWMRDHKPAPERPRPQHVVREQPTPAPVQPEVVEAAPPMPEPPVERSVAAQRAVDPVVDEASVTSPAMGVPGINGPIERGSVVRRMRAKSLALQSCWERTGDPRVTVRMTMHVDAEGRVTSASVSPGLTVPTETCIIAVLSSLSFTSPGRTTEIVQPIAFR